MLLPTHSQLREGSEVLWRRSWHRPHRVSSSRETWSDNDHYDLPQSDGLGVTIPSILLVMVLTWTVLRLNDRIHRLLGRTGSAVIARVLAVFIAAIAIQFIIDGIQTY